MATVEEVQHRASGFLQRRSTARKAALRGERIAVGPTDAPFQLFVPTQLQAAVDLAARFMEIANASPDANGLEAVLNAAEAAAREHSLELIKYALMVFITHHPVGRLLPVPPLERREPELMMPSAAGVGTRAALGPEAALDWFREDTWVNDHHAKWHIVYPGGGQPNPQNPGQRILRDRQGELFYYMHQQMLARYDTERAALGLPLTQPLFDYTSPIPEGYLANLPGFSDRAPNAVMQDLNLAGGVTYRVADHTQRRDRLAQAATTGMLAQGGTGVPIGTISLLGATAESTIGSVDGAGWQHPLSFYGSHHNFGHVLIANLAAPSGPHPTRPGVMSSTETAMRDPVFMRWHRHVDDHFFMWQQRHQPPYDFADAPPGVVIRKALAGWPPGTSPDILVCLQRDVPGATSPGFAGRVFAENTFGSATWDLPRSAFSMLADSLETRMRVESLAGPTGTVSKPYLDHEDFFYFIRAENTANEDRPVTVRVFLAAAVLAENRRMWIEMDKWGITLPAQRRVVIFRPSRLASVVRKPAWRPGEARPAFAPGTPESARTYCDCGWPYHLLLPRGTATGMSVRLMVMLTDWRVDRVGADSSCGSLSFCGARDTEYPDSRAMGYPFDRPPAAGLSVSQMLAHPALRHVATTGIAIRLV